MACGQDGRQLRRDGKLGRDSAPRMPDPERARRQVDMFPVQGQHLFPSRPVYKAKYNASRITALSTSGSIPARQRGRTSAGVEISRRGLAWNRPPSASQRLTGVVEGLDVGAGFAVERTEQRDCPVGGGPAVIVGDPLETVPNVLGVDRVERPGQPVAEIALHLVAISLDGSR